MSKSIKDNFEDLTATAKNYFESSMAYYKLDFFKKMMKITIDASHKLVLVFFLLIALLFISVAASIYIGNLLDSIPLGYLIVGGFYIILVLISAVTLKPILQRIILKRASKSYFNDKKEIKSDEHLEELQ